VLQELDTTYGLKNGIFEPLFYFVSSQQRVFWLYLVSSLAIAFFSYLFSNRETHKSTLNFLKQTFPKSIYFHRSAINDYFYFFINRLFFVLLLSPPLLMISGMVSSFIFHALKNHWGVTAVSVPAHWAYSLLLSLVIVVITDFAIYMAHFIQHRVPFFWQFHKVHHSAEVLTPLTVYRMHPVDDILTITMASLMTGVFDALFRALIVSDLHPISVLGLNVFVFVYYFVGYNLRHSHVWISYGPVLSRIFISPAQHQIHHSTAPEHWDRNLGFIFSFWDGLFGTLVVPEQKLKIQFGIGKGEEREFSNVFKMYVLPFKKYANLLKERYSKK
jgi:sterol desaturase/sphingolipid hydroxylase (fatty acid hydroxylase superfamily)